MTQRVPNSITILGNTPNIVEAVLKKALKFKQINGATVIIDYSGRGAMILNNRNKMSLLRRRVIWCDLANRVRPTACFQVARSDHLHGIFTHMLKQLGKVARTPFSDKAICWVAETAYGLSEYGTVGLGAILKTLTASEVRKHHFHSQSCPGDLDKIIEALTWVLNYSSVYAVSEGNNILNVRKEIQRPSTIWLELCQEHFEHCEHHLMAILVESLVADALLSLVSEHETSKLGKRNNLCAAVVHLFPPAAVCENLPYWVKETAGKVKHVAMHHFSPEKSLSPLAADWVEGSVCLWVTRPSSPLKPGPHGNWLKKEEIRRINDLNNFDLWVRDHRSKDALVVKADYARNLVDLSQQLRKEASKRRQPIKIRQMASHNIHSQKKRTHTDLYRRLCDLETLRLGWFKVKTGRGGSYGVDRISIYKMKENIETELRRLQRELKSGKYRCRPLRMVQIPKLDGGTRQIGVVCVRDRIVLAAVLSLLEPVFEPLFSRYSFAFRPRRSAHQAITLLSSMISSGRSWAVIADIHKCFNSIDQDYLLELLAGEVSDHHMLELVRHMITVDLVEFDDLLPISTGVPQGESLSPLLANIYLSPLDRYLERLGVFFIRYADDILCLTKNEEKAKIILGELEGFLMDPLHMALKPAKTNISSVSQGFDYLGFHFNDTTVTIRGAKIDRIKEALRLQMKAMGKPNATLQSRMRDFSRLGGFIRGIRNYFALHDETAIEEQFLLLDDRLEQLANYYLPEPLRNDPAWLGRERFFKNRNSTVKQVDSRVVPERRGKKEGYPEVRDAGEPAGWMVKQEKTIREEQSGFVDASTVDDRLGSEENGIVVNGDQLYVLVHGVYLTGKDGQLVIKKRKKVIFNKCLSEAGIIFLQGKGINISVSLQMQLAELDVALIFCPAVGKPVAVLSGTASSRPFVRGQQILRRQDPDIVSVGLRMIAAKVGNQAAVLRYFAKYRKKQAPDIYMMMTEVSGQMREIAQTLVAVDPGGAIARERAMGYEGQAAALYWGHLRLLVPAHLEFHGRVTKGAGDQINQCLNYTYGILYGLVWQAVAKAGLDPYFGIIHGAKRDRGSLVFDLIEEFRAPFADRLVFALLGRGFLPKQDRTGLLTRSCRKKLIDSFSNRWKKAIKWRSEQCTPEQILQNQADSMARLFLREGDYHPYKMRW